ncbi:hypothetical protein [Sandaracinus amylolyticus]|uniref:hypothetical protein n=1 Tax=Sandaracinus amylolyticus TaxID=927083 RepID=UPI001F37FCEB|nr:hypothetical protein [Sandaracinus amylolyticus]UJR83351.1 Hypothetical protein I5071_54190 [Sandaracinus amylolyticus]
MLGPSALARLDDRLVERIARGERLGAVIASALATIALGAGAYGVAVGTWRAPAQACFTAIKLPLLFVAVAACTIALSAMLAALLRARLGLAQTTVCVLTSFAIASAVLGSLAPIALWIAASAPPPDPSVLGLAEDDPRARPSLEVARALLLVHVAAIAVAGTIGVARLRALLVRLGNDEHVARRVIVAWTTAQLLVGSQLSWIARPFFGRPHLPPTFSVHDALEGSFYEEVWVLARSTFGPGAPLAVVIALGALAVGLARSLHREARRVLARVEPHGLVLGGHAVPWRAIARVEARGARVIVEGVADVALEVERWCVACRDPADARALAALVDRARASAAHGAYRGAAVV